MAPVCCDTSFLFAVYYGDVHAPLALAAWSRVRHSLVLSSFNRFELVNAFRLAEFRGLLQMGPAERYIAIIEQDLENGNLRVVPCDFGAVIVGSERLSRLYSCTGGYRGFDIVHVAAALYLGASEFLSFDSRQRSLARSEGLIVGP